MIKGLAITPPIVGRIAIGKVVEKNGHRLPVKDDEFTITTQVQNRDGWLTHPLDQSLRSSAQAKLRSIPVQLLFDDPNLNLRAQYTMFDRATGRPLCAGNGESCKRVTAEGLQSLPCPTPDACAFGVDQCKPYGRLNVRIVDETLADSAGENEGFKLDVDELGSFVFRTTGYNSIRTLTARLQYLHAVSGGHLSTLPLALKLRGKSTTQSHRTPIYYVDLVVRQGMELPEAVAKAQSLAQARANRGWDQKALDAAAKAGFDNGAFEDSAEEGAAVVEEFYNAAAAATQN